MADSGKKRKMSKADKEKLKKEEQERKAQEEAQPDENSNAGPSLSDQRKSEKAAKIKALEETKKQQKVEAALAIEKAKQENKERLVRRENMTELEQMLDADRQELLNINQSRRVQAKWARYMRCDGSPDPVNQGEINTYINLRMEDMTRNDAESVLKDTELTLGLIEELKFIQSDTPPEELSEQNKVLYAETTLYPQGLSWPAPCPAVLNTELKNFGSGRKGKQTITELENLISSKLELAFLQLLCDATTLANSETGNLQHTIQNDQITLCAWGNLVKNPRIRSFEFPELHFTFDIPRILSLNDCAVCLLITKFDHLSPSSKAAIPRRKKKEEEVPEEPVVEEQPVEEKKDEEQEGEDGEEKSEEKEETEIDIMAALRDPEAEEEEPKEEEPEEEAYEEDFNYPPTPEPTEWEDFEEDDDIVDLRANDVLGGVFKLSLLYMPPQPKAVGKWMITQKVDPAELNAMDYMAEAPPTNAEGVKETKENKDKKDEKTPIQISTLLPKDVMFLEEPQVARWDYKKKMWSTEGFFDPNYNEDARTFSFKTLQFGTMCFLQDAHINMPFQSWEIRPHKVNSALLTIIAAIVEIEIEIKDALCCLSQPQDKPELDSIRNKWVTPAELIIMLKRAGVNVFPNEDSSKYVNIQNKHPNIEQSMYQQMALTSSSMAYSWSKWNGQTDREQIVFQGAEALEDEPLLEEDWSIFLSTKHRVTKLKMTEFDESFSDYPATETEFKSNIYHLMPDIASETAQQRVRDTSFQFVDCVHQLLKATQVLTYA